MVTFSNFPCVVLPAPYSSCVPLICCFVPIDYLSCSFVCADFQSDHGPRRRHVHRARNGRGAPRPAHARAAGLCGAQRCGARAVPVCASARGTVQWVERFIVASFNSPCIGSVSSSISVLICVTVFMCQAMNIFRFVSGFFSRHEHVNIKVISLH